MASENQREPGNTLGRLLIDRRAQSLVNVDFHREELLTTQQLATWLGVSTQFLEIGRCRGYGPKFKVISPQVIRYRVADVQAWLKARTHASTAEYRKQRAR